MKTPLTAYLPALALLALGGCAGTTAVTTSENDGVYYSSNDHTTTIAPAPTQRYTPVQQAPSQGYTSAAGAPAAGTDEATNPDYNGSTAAGTTSGSDQYYDGSTANGYDPNASLFNQPYTGPGMGGYTPASPYTSLGGYGGVDPYYGGGGFGYGGLGYGGYGGLSPYSAFYSPFYSPFGFGYGSGLSIGFGFGQPFGYGGFGGYGYDPFYSPFGYGGYGLGYGLGAYGYGLGGYGYGGYGYGGYGNYRRNVIYTGNAGGRADYNGGNGNTVLVGPRGERSAAAYGSRGAGSNGGITPNGNSATAGGGRGTMGNSGAIPGGTITTNNAPTSGRFDRSGNGNAAGQYATPNNTDRGSRGGSFERPAGQPQGQPQMGGQAQQAQRHGFFRDMFGAPGTNGTNSMSGGQGQAANGNYNQPRQRSFEQPQQRSYQQQQQQQRSFERPSYSQPSNSGARGGFGGGGGFGGSGGGGGGGGRSGGGRGR